MFGAAEAARGTIEKLSQPMKHFWAFSVLWPNALAGISLIKIIHWIICSLANIHHEELASHKLIQLGSTGSLLWKMMLF